MTDLYLTISQLNQIFYNLTITMLGLNPTSFTNKYQPVRISWASDGQPGWNQFEDVAFIRVIPRDDEYNRIRDMTFTQIDSQNINQAMSYTRVIEVFWTLYGPNSEDNLQTIRDNLFYDSNHDTLMNNNLYMVMDVPEPKRLPEFFESKWWERVDFSVSFNELVTRNITIPYVKQVPIIFYPSTPTGATPIINISVSD